MKNWRLVAALAVASLTGGLANAVPPEIVRLPGQSDLYFAENDLVYGRYLWLARDGSYRQFNREYGRTREADRGTWRQDAQGRVLLQSTRDALRYRSLLSGPLLIVPDRTAVADALSAVAEHIRRLLDRTTDSVFAVATARELHSPPAEIVVAHAAETFSRDDLNSLVLQIEHFVESVRTHVYAFTVYKPKGLPPLLIQSDAVFQPHDVARVLVDHPAHPGAPLPFYFTKVDAATFARCVGPWQELPLLGDLP